MATTYAWSDLPEQAKDQLSTLQVKREPVVEDEVILARQRAERLGKPIWSFEDPPRLWPWLAAVAGAVGVFVFFVAGLNWSNVLRTMLSDGTKRGLDVVAGAIAVASFAVGTVVAARDRHERRRLPLPEGVYLFPWEVLEVRRAGLTLLSLDDVTETSVEDGRRLVFAFRGGEKVRIPFGWQGRLVGVRPDGTYTRASGDFMWRLIHERRAAVAELSRELRAFADTVAQLRALRATRIDAK
ncbi:MAG: hypothetical protein U0183_25685 [Polyangiaceae bacterium]